MSRKRFWWILVFSVGGLGCYTIGTWIHDAPIIVTGVIALGWALLWALDS